MPLPWRSLSTAKRGMVTVVTVLVDLDTVTRASVTEAVVVLVTETADSTMEAAGLVTEITDLDTEIMDLVSEVTDLVTAIVA